VREDSVAAGGACLVALGLDHSRKPAESAAVPPVGHQLVRHQVYVIDQNERDACGRVRRGGGKADATNWNKQKAGGKAAVDEEHGGMLLVPRSEVGKPLRWYGWDRDGVDYRLSRKATIRLR
jgi:hypothetical protein